MNNHLTINDLLDQWVKNEITFDELAVRSGKEDLSELQDSMDMQKLAVLSIQKHAVASQVASVHQTYMKKRIEQQAPIVKVVPINRQRLAVKIASAAALFAVLLVAAQMLFISSNRIYSEAFTGYHANNERSITAPASSNITLLFEKEDYAGLLSTYNAGISHNNKEIFLAGYSSLLLKDYESASKYFSTILNASGVNNIILYRDEAEYYLALSYLKAGKHEAAFQLMEKIYSDPEHTYHDVFDKWTMMRMKWLK